MNKKFSIIPEYGQLEKTVELAQKYNLGFEYNDFCDPAVYEDNEEVQKRCRTYRQLDRDRSQDTLHGVFLDIAVTSRDTAIRGYSRKLVEQSMNIAENLEAKGVVFHTGLIGELQIASYIEPWLYESEKFWRTLAGRYPQIEIYMENTFEKAPDVLLQLKKSLEDIKNFKLCLDYGHACLTPTPIETWSKKMRKYTGHIHLNDNDLKADLHQVPGEGEIDFEQCRSLLEQYSDEISVLLEINGIEKQKKAVEYMRKL